MITNHIFTADIGDSDTGFWGIEIHVLDYAPSADSDSESPWYADSRVRWAIMGGGRLMSCDEFANGDEDYADWLSCRVGEQVRIEMGNLNAPKPSPDAQPDEYIYSPYAEC